MKITRKIKLLPTSYQDQLLTETTLEYIRAVNSVISDFAEADKVFKYSSKDVCGGLPSALKNQLVLDAKSIFKKHKKGVTKTLAVLKKPVAVWNNQNYKVREDSLSFPVWINNKSQRINVKAIIPAELLQELQSVKLGTLRITRKGHKWIAQIAVEATESISFGDSVMGVDLGIKVLAVAHTESGKTRFFGNGRKNKYMKRKFKTKRRELGKAKKQNAIEALNQKEQRWMQDKDHKISRQIVNFAKENNVSTIALERLQNIRNTTRTSRKNNHSLHSWSFYRLASYIEYKAKLEGIEVVYINPAYTSQYCPECGVKNHAKDRTYRCTCGYEAHRDIVGAINIMRSTVVDGNSLSA